MKIKMIFSDFDGTLLRSDQTILQKTALAIERFRKEGGYFTIATGRMLSSIRQYFSLVGLDKYDMPVATCQGNMLNMSVSGKLLHYEALKKETATQILQDFEAEGIIAQVYILEEDGNDRLFVNSKNPWSDAYSKYTKVEYSAVGKLSEYVQGLSDGRNVIKVLAFIEDNSVRQKLDTYSKKYGNQAQFTSSRDDFFEASSPKGGKEEAVKRACKSLNVLIEETACVGDQLNDLAMIRLAGLGCAVENACKDLKDCAKLVVPSNDQNGVGELIEHILGNN